MTILMYFFAKIHVFLLEKHADFYVFIGKIHVFLLGKYCRFYVYFTWEINEAEFMLFFTQKKMANILNFKMQNKSLIYTYF